MPALFEELQVLSAEAGASIFQIPPYFAYIAKAFATLEGIGLSADPNYSILNETLPYISRRILTDPSPRTAGALESFLFGDAKTDVSSRVLDAGRVATLVDGAKRYASTTTPTDGTTAATTPTAAALPAGSQPLATTSAAPAAAAAGLGVDLEAAVDTVLDLLLAREATPVQTIALEQIARITGAAGRERWAELRKQSGSPSVLLQGRSRLGALADPLGIFRGSPLIETDATDREALKAASKLTELATELSSSGADAPLLSQAEQQQFNRILLRKLWEKRAELQLVSRRLAATLLDQTVQRVLTPRNSV